MEAVRNCPDIDIKENHFAVEIITQHHLGARVTRRTPYINCYGAYVLNPDTQKVDTEPMSNAPRKVAPLTDEDGQQMTDLFLFDGSTLLLRQQSTDPDFGTVTVMLTEGEHHLHFVATRSTELSYDDGVLNCASLRPTFGKHYDLIVSGKSDEYVTMERITGLVVITIEDEIPADAASLRIQMGDFYKGMNPTTFAGVQGSPNHYFQIGRAHV